MQKSPTKFLLLIIELVWGFPKIKTKEDYVLWLKILKKISYIRGINKNLTNYRKRKGSLSSNILTSIINGFKVYKNYMKMGYAESIYRLIILSISYLKKKFSFFPVTL